jgi:hypothetical protein
MLQNLDLVPQVEHQGPPNIAVADAGSIGL